MSKQHEIYPKVLHQINLLDLSEVNPERLSLLQEISTKLKFLLETRTEVHILIVCTHNSRRSQLAQVWGQILSVKYALAKVRFFSAGTESTAVPAPIINTLKDVGLDISISESSVNPVINVRYSDLHPPLDLYSKTTDHASIPKNSLVVIQVCADVAESCPYIPGAEATFALPFNDPKEYDNLPQQADAYKQSCLEIGAHLNHLMSGLKSLL